MFKKFQLKNGLTVLFVESHKSPVVSVQMWVRTGSADEKASLRGISHFIEHLVFKGSEKYKVGQIASTVEGAGGELNAYTSFDQTVFYVTISRQFTDTALDIVNELMSAPLFDEAEINNEREVVIEEIKRGNDSSHRQASRLLFEALYKRHPYGAPVIGYEEIIRKVSRRQLLEYFNTRYVPSNMTLMVVGDFSASEMKTKVTEVFGKMKKRRLKPAKRFAEKLPTRPKVAVRQSTFQEEFLFLAWPIPKASHKDIAALDALAMILGQGDSSRLTKALRMERGLVNYIGASTFTPQDPGFFAVSASLTAENLKVCLDQVEVELKTILHSLPTAEELTKVLTNAQSDQYYTMESVDGMARKYGHFEHLFDDYKYFEKYNRQLLKLTPKDLHRVARKYLTPETLSAIMLTSQPEDGVTRQLRDWQEKFTAAYGKNAKVNQAKKFVHAKSRDWFPQPTSRARKLADVAEKYVCENGAVILMRPNYDTPVLSVKAALLGGARLETAETQGLTELLSRTWVSATQKRTEEQLLEKIEHLASSLSAFGGRNTCGLNLTTLVPFAEEGLDLFSEVLTDSKLSDTVAEREKVVMLEQLKTRRDNPAQIAILRFMEQMFSGHPYGRDPMGTEASVRDLKALRLTNHLKTINNAHNISFSVTGHFEPDRMRARLEKLADQLPKGKRELSPINWKASDQQRAHFEKSEKEQTHLVIGYPALSINDPRRYALQIIEAVLSGQGGRLFLELRDKASLAYSVAPLRMEGIEGGYFGGYIGCSPEKGVKALAMLKTEFSRLTEELIGANELDRAKRYLVGRHDIELQKNSTVASAMLFDEIYGIDHTETFHYPERILAVTSEQVLNLARQIFAQQPVLSAVGPVRPW